ncbi:MAG TPA: sialidase family protein, partial [Polyangiaceae bacterium]|nr:sialidase family protein [Polyangiaceae bacterium]
MNRSYRLALIAPLAAAVTFFASTTFANGRFPAADQLLIDPSDPTHIVVRTTFGFVESRDAGKTWLWTCEDIIGRIANSDPPFTVTGDGTVVVAVPFEGVSISHDHGCSWTRAPAPLAGQLAVDVTLEPTDPAGVLVLTSTNDTSPDAGPAAPPEFLNLVVETKDHGVSWAQLGAPLARDFIASTIEIAGSDPNRIYASGVFGEPLKPAIERSEDGGKTWTRTMVPSGGELGNVYISAVDAGNPNRLFVRVLAPADAASGATPTTLLESTDKGSTWREVAKTDDAMLGFALAPDGAKLAYGSIGHGIFVGPSDGSAPLVKVSEVQNRCLTWSSAGLYACGTDLGRGAPATAPFTQPADTFAVGLSHDMGTSYDTLYRLFQTCPTTCPDDSRYNRTCRTTWELKPGVTTATGATGETCTVPWAKTE